MTASLYKPMILITLLCVLCAVVAMFIGQFIPPPPRTDFLSQNTCEFPCIYGVTLGETERETVIDIFSKMGSNVVSAQTSQIVHVTQPENPTAVDGSYWFTNATDARVQVTQLTARLGGEITTLGDLFLRGYQPRKMYRTCLSASERRILIVLDDEGLFVAGMRVQDSITPDTPITLLYNSLNERMFPLASLAYFGACTVEIDWQGFASANRYFVQ